MKTTHLSKAAGLLHIVEAARQSAASLVGVATGVVAAVAAAVPSVRLAAASGRESGTNRGQAMFEEAKAVKDQLGFMSEVKRELDELFSFLEEFKRETGTSLIIVLFVDDLDRCLGGKNAKVLEAIQLMLSIPGVPILVFLAIDSRVVVASIEESFGEILRGAYISGWEVRVSGVL